MKPLRALTLWPEWVWGIHHLDKRIENSSWPLPLGEWFALHAGKSIGGRLGFAAEWRGIRDLASMAAASGWDGWAARVTFGGSTRWSVEFTRCGATISLHDPRAGDVERPIIRSAITGLFRVTEHRAPGTAGPWKDPAAVGNVFEYRPLRESVPCRGARGLWTVPEGVAARVWEVSGG